MAKTKSKGFGDLPEDERLRLLHIKYVEGQQVAVPGINQSTLNRGMRREKSRLEKAGEWHKVLSFSVSGPRTSQEFDGPNLMSAGLKGGPDNRIWTLGDLVSIMEIDMEEWQVYKITGNTYEGYRKNEEKELTWVDGKITEGFSIDRGGLWIEPMMSIKAWFVRKTPVEVTPLLRPVEIHISKSILGTPVRSYKQTYEQALIVPDLQIGYTRDYRTGKLTPFHDREAIDVVLQLAQTDYFDKIVFLGDLLDMTMWTDRFIRLPEFVETTQPALIEAAWWLAQFREAAPSSKMFLLEGNHEVRITSKLATHVPEALGLRAVNELRLAPSMSIPKLLGLEFLDVEWVDGYPNNKVWLSDYLACEHGSVARTAGATAPAVVAQREFDVIFGHIHRAEMATRLLNTKSGPKTIMAMSPGFLGHIDGRVPGHKLTQDWNQGFAVAEYTEEGRNKVNHFPIDLGETMYEGIILKGRDRVKDLRSFAVELSGGDWGF